MKRSRYLDIDKDLVSRHGFNEFDMDIDKCMDDQMDGSGWMEKMDGKDGYCE